MGKRVTIKDIATAAGVTPQAVSRALRDESDISVATKIRIREIARQLNYVKNSSASSLRSGDTKVIAVLYDNPLNLYFSFMTAYLHGCLKARGYSMLMIVEPVRRLSLKLYRSVLSRNVDGILSFLEPTEEIGEAVEEYGVPVVLVGRRTDVKNIDCIYTDDKKGGELAAEYLLAQGAKRIVCFSENLDLTCAQDRFDGFKERLERAGVFDRSLMCFLDGKTPAERWTEFLKEGRAFDGVFCFSDYLAYETVCKLSEAGINVAMVGYDDVREKIPVPYPLSSVGSDKRSIAESSVEFLLDKIDGKRTVRREKKFDVHFVER